MNYYEVGKIVNTHGLQGEVKIYASSDFQKERFAENASLFLFDTRDNLIEEVQVSHSRLLKSQTWLVRFKGLDNINQVEKYKNYSLKVSEKQLSRLGEGEFYYHEIIGLSVYEKKEKIGEIAEILQPGANDVWIVKRSGKKDLLLPYIASVVLSVDLDADCVQVEIPEGLDDEA